MLLRTSCRCASALTSSQDELSKSGEADNTLYSTLSIMSLNDENLNGLNSHRHTIFCHFLGLLTTFCREETPLSSRPAWPEVIY